MRGSACEERVKGLTVAFKLGLAQCCHPGDGDVLGMVDTWAARAKAAGVDVLVFPESLMTPFDATAEEFAAAAEPIDGPFCSGIDALAAKHGLWIVYTANERNDGNEGDDGGEGSEGSRPFNTAIIVDAKGAKRAVYRKVHLFDTDFVKESDKISAGGKLVAPVETPFGRIGVGICYDLRFPELARAAALAGADVLVYPSAWVDGPRKVDQWRTLLAARAIENEFFVAGLSRCDRAFGEVKRDYAGYSCVFGPLGEVVSEARGIEEELLIADIDLTAIAKTRTAMPVLSHRRPEAY